MNAPYFVSCESTFEIENMIKFKIKRGDKQMNSSLND